MRRSKAASTARRPASVNATPPATHETRRRHFAGVDQRQHGRVGHQRAELLGQVQGQRGPTVARPVIEPQHRIEPGRLHSQSQLLGQDRIEERQQRVDRIAGRPAVAALDVELVAALEQSSKGGEIRFGRHALEAEQAGRVASLFGPAEQQRKLMEHLAAAERAG